MCLGGTNQLMVNLSSSVTQGPYFRTYGPYFRTSSKSLNGQKIVRMAPIWTIFGPNRSRRRDLLFEKNSSERRRHRRLVVVSSSSSPSSWPLSSQHNYLRSELLRTTVSAEAGDQVFLSPLQVEVEAHRKKHKDEEQTVT